MADDYEAYRQNKIESGCCFQDFVADLVLRETGIAIATYTSRLYQMRAGESRQGFEIKHDERYKQTGNLYIETAEKARPRPGAYAASGIFRNDNTWLYIIGNYDEVFCLQKSLLRALAHSGHYRIITNGTCTSQGFLLPGSDANRIAALILRPGAEQRIVKGGIEQLHRDGKELYRILTADPAQPDLWEPGT